MLDYYLVHYFMRISELIFMVFTYINLVKIAQVLIAKILQES